MTTVTMVTMATMKISNFAPQNHTFCHGAVFPEGIADTFLFIFVFPAMLYQTGGVTSVISSKFRKYLSSNTENYAKIQKF